MKLNAINVFVLVMVAAIVGVVLGGALGYAAGTLAPDLFKNVLVWKQLERPAEIGMVTVAGAGAIFGGCAAAFAIIIQVISQAIAKRKGSEET